MGNNTRNNWLHTIVEKNESVPGRIFDGGIMFFIILSIISFSLETLPNLDAQLIGILDFIETVSVIVFTIEYALRIYVAKRKWKFVFSFYGIIDLLAILPFYLAAGLDLRVLRSIRLLRVFRALKILRYNRAIDRFYNAFCIAREELILFFSTAMLIFFFAAVGIYYFENPAQPEVFQSVFHSLWWAVATLTTVGYGDIYPVTVGGKVFTFFILMIGLGIVAVPSGLMASALSEARLREKEKNNQKTKD